MDINGQGTVRDDGKQPDGLTLIPWSHGKCLLWDATCRDTLAKSYIKQTSKHVGWLARTAEEKKISHYSSLLNQYHFVPLGFETLGPWGPNAKFISDLGDDYSGISFAARLSLQPRPYRSSIASDDNSFEYRRKSSGGSHYIVSSNNNNNDTYIYACDDVERHPDGTVVLRSAGLLGVGCISSSSTSQQFISANASSSQENTPLYRLAKLLNQNIKPTQSPILKDDTPRRLSWERRELVSASIHSMVEAVWSESSRPSLTVYPPESTSSTYARNLQTLTISNESSSTYLVHLLADEQSSTD